jgi:phosphoribosyl-dephospho-CoA transferase
LNVALTDAPWVVARRAPATGGLVPVGVRGSCRAERCAAFLPASSITERIGPEDLSSSRASSARAGRDQLPAFSALSRLQTLLRGLDILWGPVGSVGFELASGAHVVHRRSDLDVIVRQTDFVLSPGLLNDLLAVVESSEVAIDILVETGSGGFALLDYSNKGETIVVRTEEGPRQILHPMNRAPSDSCAGRPGSTSLE